jgi:hypothetical protein
MWSPAVSPWSASLLFLLLYVFPAGDYTDLEVARDGTVWVLPVGRSELFRVPEDGAPERFFLQGVIRPAGLFLDDAGGVLISDAAAGTVTLFDRFMEPAAVTTVPGTPGDLALSGLSLWYIDTERGLVVDARGLVLSRDVPSDAALFFQRGTGLLAGGGVRLLSEGSEPAVVSDLGRGCLSGGSVLILRDSVLFRAGGDTLAAGVVHTRVSSSPDGRTVVLWGGTAPPAVLD